MATFNITIAGLPQEQPGERTRLMAEVLERVWWAIGAGVESTLVAGDGTAEIEVRVEAISKAEYQAEYPDDPTTVFIGEDTGYVVWNYMDDGGGVCPVYRTYEGKLALYI